MRKLLRPQGGCVLFVGFIVLALLSGCVAQQWAASADAPTVSAATPAQRGRERSFMPPTTTAPTALAATPPAQPTITSTPTFTPTATPTPTATMTATPGPTPDGIARALRVPILMYHYISEPPADADIYRRDNSVSPERFESHLRYLREAGYHTITLDDLLYALAQGRTLPEQAVILTFDDGYEDGYTNAFPLLQRYALVGHFFIITDFINQGRPGYMTWPQIEEMAAAGQRFGSHSRDHPNLRGKPLDYLVWQALGGKESIEEHLGYHPRWISYPAGSYDEQTIAVYKSAHYWGGLTVRQGATHTLEDIFELQRVRVRGSYTAEDLARLLALDW